MDNPLAHRGSCRSDVLTTLLAVVLLLAVALPVLGKLKGDAGVQASISNLTALGVAHVLYAADWNGRQVTWTRDDLGEYGSITQYNYAQGCHGGSSPACQPPIIAGLGPAGDGYGYWGYWGDHPFINPMIWPGGPDDSSYYRGLGHFRIANAKPFHEYVNGRYQDPTFYAPNDEASNESNAQCFDSLYEFDPDCNPGWSSYCLSPAALFHPDVMRAVSAGGWQNPWGLAQGFQSPGLFQAAYPNLKTHMLEFHWLQNAPAPCNPIYPNYCQPFQFNHGLSAAPATLFYDGSTRLLPNAEALAADVQIFKQTGGLDGAWHRGTPFGFDGYFIADGFDLSPISHHILTTGGILGRDTVGQGYPALPPTPGIGEPGAEEFGVRALTRKPIAPPLIPFTTEDGE